MAKLASRAAKPVPAPGGPRPGAGVVVVLPSEELSFLHPLPVRALWGVGPATARRLKELGVDTVGDLARIPSGTLCRTLGTANGTHLAALARGEDARPVEADRETKSVGHEETFAADIADPAALHRHLVRMADAVGTRLRQARLQGRTVTVKVRFGDRATITRSHTVGTPSTPPGPSAPWRVSCSTRWTWRGASGCWVCRCPAWARRPRSPPALLRRARRRRGVRSRPNTGWRGARW